ncbi:hypothetical protein HALTITAN_2426, partial [Vreelandella titanicae BH1]
EEDGTLTAGAGQVTFTPGSNDAGYYAFDGENVVLTQDGVDAINAGTTLPAVSLTATDSDNATAEDSDTPSYVANPDAVATTGEGQEDSSGIDIELSGGFQNGDGTILSFVIQTLPANGTLYFGNTVVTEGMPIDATDNSATLTFVPEADWSDNNGDGKVTFDYIAIDGEGNQSDPATATIDVTPVTDIPDVELTLTESTTSSLYAVDLSNVLDNADGQSGNPAGFTVTAFKDGQTGVISIKETGSPTGFGVAGSASNGADSEIGKGEELHIELDTPASSVTFQLAWLNNYNETAVYEVHYDDGSSETFSVFGGSDGIDPPKTVDAPEGKAITGIDFGTGSVNESTSDYLLHSFSYESVAKTYTVDITAEPSDTDFSESITSLVVKTPEGVTLSGAENQGTDNGITSWGISLDANGGFTNSVEVDPNTGIVTVKGLILSVPDDFTGDLTVEAIATAYDPDAATSAQGSDSETIENNGPTSSDDSVTMLEGAESIVLSVDDFGNYSDPDGDSLDSIRIESLPASEVGKLQLNGNDIARGEEISVQQIASGELAFIPANDDTDSDTSFEFRVSDGGGWSEQSYTTTVNIDAVADKPTVAISLGDAMSVDETGTISGQSREFTELLGEERGDGNIQGTPNYNYSEASTQVFDFGTVFAGQQVTVDMPVLIQGSWNSGWNVFDDRWVVRANGDEEFVFDDYGSSSNYNLNFVDNVSITTTLDSQGRLTLEFSAATTETSETATIQGATVSVGSVEVTEVSAYQYAVDLTAALSDTDGSETLSIKVTGVPEGGVLSQGAEQGDGSWLIEVDPGETSYSGNGLTLTVPVGQAGEDFQLSAEAIATESNPGTTDTTVETLTRSATDSAESKTVPIPPDNTASEPDDNSGEPEGSWEGFESNDDHTLNWWDPSEPYNLGGNATSVDIELQGFGGVFDSGYVEFYEDGNSLGYSYLSKGSNNGSFEQTFTPGFEFDSVKVVRTGGEFEIKSLAAYNATQAQLVDGIVEGAMYTTSSGLSGTTDENGAFEYRDGDSVTFMVGDVVIGTASAEALADGKVFLQEMANTELTDLNNEYVENMAVFLQSLDADGIADNGITITSAMNAAFEGSTLDLRNVSEAELKSALEGVGDSYVTEEDAMQHVRDMLEKHAGITTFDEHTDDSIKTAVLAHDVIDGLTYQTSSGLIGELTDGMFAFDEGDTVELFANGQLVASFATADIGDDGLITFAEAGFLMSAEELDALINSEEETQPSVEGEEAVDEPEPTDDTTVDDAEDIDEEESRDDNITNDDTSSSDKASEDESEEEVVEEGVATPDDEQSQDDALTQGDELAQEEVLADNDEVTNVAPATPGDEKEEPESSGNGYSLLEDDETLFTLNDDSENATTPVPASELQTSESEGDIEASLSESELFSSDEDESVDSLLPPSESGEEKAKPAPDAPQESTVSTEVEPAGGHTDYVKLHNDHATSNSDI